MPPPVLGLGGGPELADANFETDRIRIDEDARAADNDAMIRTIRMVNVIAFGSAGVMLFALSVHPASDDAGLAFLSWLAVFGTVALIAEHQVLEAARAVLPGVSVAWLFTRAGRRALRSDPEHYFIAEDYARFRSRYRALAVVAAVAAVALLGVGYFTVADDVRSAAATLASQLGGAR